MGNRTKISWTDATWSPVTGCSAVSPGCTNCYARRMSHRLAGRFGYPANEPFRVTRHPERLGEPLRWSKPRRIFVCSMGDLFHRDVPWEFIRQVFSTMWDSPQHTFFVLTKRPGRMDYFAERILEGNWPSNVWAGTSVGEAKYLPWLDAMGSVPAPVKFLSAEPLLGPLDLREHLRLISPRPGSVIQFKPFRLVDWVIVGGESGPGARPMKLDWVRSIRDQCQEAGVPFFFKGAGGLRQGTGTLLDGREWKEKP